MLWRLETLVLLGVLDVENILGYYLVHLCDASEGAKRTCEWLVFSILVDTLARV